jgi:hypothetical protein
MCDFNGYYNFAHYGDRKEWYYKDWLAFIWRVIESYQLWYVLSSVCVLILVWKLLEVKWGWVMVAPCLKVAGWTLGSGNIQPILALACITPLGCLVAGLVKPQLLSFMGVHAFVRYRDEMAHRKSTAIPEGCRSDLPISIIPNHTKEEK